ncbi:putative glycosyltransferase [Thiosulfatimonas sediminis]|uniref:Putative glycosyltransferase n=1 Tax=Thiosulfatimonas sediminis TaxID=2675054 RepID=A0A6F8PT15_9GAMM|nr:glycosyltransferase family 4 protein [Thiosulfatimonas sediminis]BBP45271.1 putative glycosyltransferase [Thiosulfatimonas sediminis]
MKHIAFFISDISSTGGTERISFLVANYLQNLGYKVSFLTLNKKNNELFFPLNENINIHLIREQKKSHFGDLLKIRRVFKKNNFDVVIDVDSVLTPYTFLSKFGLKKTKHIVWEHFNAAINLGIKRRDLGRYLGARYADRCVVLTQEDKQQWQSKFSAENVTVIYNPVTTQYSEFPILFKPGKKKIILGVGRLAEQKGFDLLLKSWCELSPSIRAQAVLHIAGDGVDKQKLVDYVAHHNLESNVKFLGHCSNITEIYKNSYAYVLSSRFEGFVLSLLEAMASGLPVVSYDCPCGPKELLSTEYGLLVEKNNVSALAAALEKIITETDLRDQFALKAFERSFDFTPDAILPQWSKLLGELYE